MPVISLTTDFGLQDWFVGTMKGVIARIAPAATVIDLTHGIPNGDVRAGAFALMCGYSFFPKGAVHVAVVDPGVGSKRRAIAAITDRYVFVGPDNGVLSWALRREKIHKIYIIENSDLFLQPVSRTFHGRDVFAPVAAHLASGLDPASLGPRTKDFVQLPWPKPIPKRGEWVGEIVYIDRFGNAITNMPNPARAAGVVRVKRQKLLVMENYQTVPAGKALAVPSSSGFLELAVNAGHFAKKFGAKIGDMVSYAPA